MFKGASGRIPMVSIFYFVALYSDPLRSLGSAGYGLLWVFFSSSPIHPVFPFWE
jgi:hypothetical protein